MKHTPEPWAATTTPAGKGKVVDEHGFSICYTGAGSYKQMNIDAARIVACVNSCATISTTALKSGVIGEMPPMMATLAALVRIKYGNLDKDINGVLERADAILAKLEAK